MLATTTTPKYSLVLVGPMLRRVELDSVSVFVVLSRKVEKVVLKIQTGINPFFNTFEVPLKGETEYIPQFGDQFFATVVTATPVSIMLPLVAGQIYYYTLDFVEKGVSKGMLDAGVLVPMGDLVTNPSDVVAYGDDDLPSFVAPVTEIADLNIVHGSCRKPHGGTQDALMGLDVMLNYTYRDARYRPQQLFLTGDQIYGDDVADVVSHICQEMMPDIMGYTETLPDVPTTELLKPGTREEVVQKYAGFTCFDGYGKSHSIRFADYCGLYLLAWSDVLWPTDLVTFSELGTPTKESTFDKEFKAVTDFKSNMKGVRKIFANIAVLTVFDDHDVCDDWFLNRRWVEDVGSKDLGKRILQNGLSSFAIFQAWGNTPERFEERTTGREILALLEQIYSEKGINGSSRAALGSILLPTYMKTGDYYAELSGGMRWDYAINYGKYMVLALNTRTNREYKGISDFEAASLLSPTAMTQQINANYRLFADAELLILISGAPVFGHPALEDVVQPTSIWVQNARENSFVSNESGESKRDNETWKGSQSAFEDLLSRLVIFKRVVILSGDVHYGFSASIDYWDKRAGITEADEKRAVFLQFVSSSLKNSTDQTNAMTLLPMPYKYVAGWQSVSKPAKKGTREIIARSNIAVENRDDFDTILEEPGWEYRIVYLNDSRLNSSRGIPYWHGTLLGWKGPDLGAIADALLASKSVNPYVRMGTYGAAVVLDGDRQSVGLDNIAQIRFKWTANDKFASQCFWCSPALAQGAIIPYTLHEISFKILPYSQKSRPTDGMPRATK